MVIKIPLIFILILNTYLLFNSDFGNLVPETNEGEAGSIILFHLFGGAIIVGEWGSMGLSRKSHSYFRY